MSPRRPPQALAVTVMIVSATSFAVGPSASAPRAPRPSVRLSLGLLAGTTARDAALADYQWDVTPRAAWGTHVLAGYGPLEGGLRVLQTSTHQELGLPNSVPPTVRATTVEAVAGVRLGAILGTHVLATASGGRMHLGYHPERIDVDLGTGSPVTVNFSPIDEWIAGAGLALRRPLPGPWTVGVELDRRVFRMEAAHREGNQVVVSRETFGEWSARLELNWQLRRR